MGLKKIKTGVIKYKELKKLGRRNKIKETLRKKKSSISLYDETLKEDPFEERTKKLWKKTHEREGFEK